MAHTIVLEDIPQPIFQRVRAESDIRRLSLSGAVLSLLQPPVSENRQPVEDQIAFIRETRALLEGRTCNAHDIDAFKREGRP